MNEELALTTEFKSRIEGRFLVWVSEVDGHVRPDSMARVSIDTFGNGWGMVPKISHDGAAAVIFGVSRKNVIQAKFGRSHSTREGFSFWLAADQPLTGEFLLTELLDIECVFDGEVQFSPNQAFYEWIQAEGGGKYLVHGKDWIGVLSFNDATAPHNGYLKAFSFGPVSWEANECLFSVDSDQCRGELVFGQASVLRGEWSETLPADRLETNRIHNEAWAAFSKSGEFRIPCPTCGDVIRFEVLSEFTHRSACKCGRFNCVTRM